MKTDSFIEAKIKDARQAISAGFCWSDTPQGGSYWSEVVRNLDGLEDAVKAKSRCKDEIADLKRRLAELESRCS